MNKYRKNRIEFPNFNQKVIRMINFANKSKKFVKVQVSKILQKNDAAEKNGKIRNAVSAAREKLGKSAVME